MGDDGKVSGARLDASSELSGTTESENKESVGTESNRNNAKGEPKGNPIVDEKIERKQEQGSLGGFFKSLVRKQNQQTETSQASQVQVSKKLDDQEKDLKNESKETSSSSSDGGIVNEPPANDSTAISGDNENIATGSNQIKSTSVKNSNQAKEGYAEPVSSFMSLSSQMNPSMREHIYSRATLPTDPLLAINDPSRLALNSDSYSDRLISYSLMFGLPLLGLIMITILFWIIVKFLRDFFNRKSKKDNKSSGVGFNPDNKKHHSPIGFISNGKVMEGVKIISRGIEDKKHNFGLSRQSESNSIENFNEQKITPTKTKKVEGSNDGVKKRRKSKLDYFGRLKYQLSYDFTQSILSVHIIQAEQLPGLDFNGLSDPYVKVFLMPDKRKCDKTRVHKSNLNPIFQETFQFHVPFPELTSKTLVMAVYDYDRFSKHDEIGQVSIPIGRVDLTQTKEEWADLKRITDADSGQVSVYRTDASSLSVRPMLTEGNYLYPNAAIHGFTMLLNLARRYLSKFALRANCWQAHSRCDGGSEPQEDGFGGFIRPLR